MIRNEADRRMMFRVVIIEADGAEHPGAELFDNVGDALVEVAAMNAAVDSNQHPVWVDVTIEVRPVLR